MTGRGKEGAPTPGSLSLREAWRISKFPYVELVYRSAQLSGSAGSASALASADADAKKRFRSILTNAKMSKAIFTLFVCLGAAIPFAGFAAAPVSGSLAGAVSLSLLIGFAYLFLFSLQILPSFSGAEPYPLLLALPFSEGDFSKVAALSFFRTFDYLAAGAVLIPFAAVLLLTQSVLGSVLALAASTVNALFAVVMGLWISRLFYKNITRGGRSKGAALTRMVFLITWGFAMLSIGFLFNIATSLIPYVSQVIAGNLSQTLGVALSVLYPFTFGFAVASAVFPTLFASPGLGGAGASLVTTLSYGAAVVYVLIAIIAGRRATGLVASITHGQALGIIRETAKEFTLKLRRPFFAYMTKDLRVASKSPSTAFLFAIPEFVALFIYMSLYDRAALNVFDVVSMTVTGSLFAVLAGLMLLNTEGKGLECTLSMPLSASVIVNAKSLIATLTYAPVPVVLLLLQLAKSGAWTASSLIPFIEIPAISAATTAAIAVFVTSRGAAGGGGSRAPGSGGPAGGARSARL